MFSSGEDTSGWTCGTDHKAVYLISLRLNIFIWETKDKNTGNLRRPEKREEREDSSLEALALTQVSEFSPSAHFCQAQKGVGHTAGTVACREHSHQGH